MRPLSQWRAKPTLPVLGLPILGRVLAVLSAQGVRSFAVNAHHAAGSVRDTVAHHTPRECEVEVYEESELMGSAGAYLAPSSRLAAEPMFVAHNADTLVDVRLADLAAAAARSERTVGALLVRPGRAGGYGALRLSGTRVTGIAPADQPSDDLLADEAATFLGVAVLRREVLERVSRGGPSHLFHDLLLPMIEDGWQLETQPHVGLWLEFTTPDGYRRALGRLMRQADREGRIELPGGDVRVERHREGVIFCAADATCERGATACGAVVVESGARLRRGAIVDDCVLLEGSEAGSGSVLRQAVLGEHARAGASDRIRGGCLTARHVEPRSTATSRAADGTVADDAS